MSSDLTQNKNKTSQLTLFRGPQEEIDKMNLEDGTLYFATDTKSIYLDCDYTDPRNEILESRIKFGNATGIHYAYKEPTENEISSGKYIFSISEGDLTGKKVELPEIDDLILNTKNGSFYRVTARYPEDQYVTGLQLTVSGGGGGGSGPSTPGASGIVYREILSSDVTYLTKYAIDAPFQFTCRSSNEGARIDVELYINDAKVDTFEDVSITEVNTINLAKYLSYYRINNTTTFSLKFTDEYGATSTRANLKVFTYDMYLQYIQTGLIAPQSGNYDFRCYPWGGIIHASNMSNYSLKNRKLVCELRKTGTTSIVKKYEVLTTADRGSSEESCTIEYPGAGEYTLTAWLQGELPDGSGTIIRSESIDVEIPFYDENGDPLITATSGITHAVQYDQIDLYYMVSYGQSSESKLKLYDSYEDENGIYHADTTGTIVKVVNGVATHWALTFNKAGIHYLSIVYLNNAGAETSIRKDLAPIVVEKFEGVPEIDTTNNNFLKLYLTSKDRSNNELNRDSWTSLAKNNTFTVGPNNFENFNWTTNGWMKDADGNTALHLTNGAKVTIPYSPFTYNALEKDGLTLELDFRISNVRNSANAPITCNSTIYNAATGVSSVQSGLRIFYNKAQLDSDKKKTAITDMSGRTTVFFPGNRIRLAYVITHDNFAPARMVYTYLNGVISGLNICDEDDSFKEDPNSPAYFVFDSADMDIDIYNIRVYSNANSYSLILNNNMADSDSPQEAIERSVDNNVLDVFSSYDNPDTIEDESTEIIKISLEEVKAKKNIPYMVFEDGRPTGSKKDGGWFGYDPDDENNKDIINAIKQAQEDEDFVVYPNTNESRLPTGKKDFRHMKMYYVDPIRGERWNIGSEDNPVIITAYAQGTSSMEYPIKNIRIYFKKPDPNNEHAPTPSSQIAKYQLEDKIAKVNLFTLKADYMDSSSAHNTGTANILNDLYHSINLYSPAQKAFPDQNVLTAILGHPIICFFKPYKPNAQYPDYYQYIGRYNFNLDKATHELFGFESTMEGGADGKTIWGYLTDKNGQARDGFNSSLEYTEGRVYYTKPDRELLDIEPIEWTTASAEEKTSAKVITFATEKAWATEAKSRPLYEYKTAEEGVTCIQCWECLNNPSNLVGMREYWDEEVDATVTYKPDDPTKVAHSAYATWTNAFESRFPEHETEASTDKRALARVINWLASTNRNSDVIAKDLIAKGTEATPENIAAESAARLNKFNNELADYFNLDFLAFYYVLTETLMMIDSRGKNMMLACFDADPENNIGHWLPIFYDMDTMLGVDNSGNLRFEYSQEDTDKNTFNLATTYDQPQYSVLWTNYHDARQADIKAMYLKLRKAGKFNSGTLRKQYNANQADAWNETYLNEDVDVKYISPLLNKYEVYLDAEGNIITKEEAEKMNFEGVTRKTAANYLYASQGTRSQHRDFWLTNRFNYLDSKYGYSVDQGTQKAHLNCRVNAGIAGDYFDFNFYVKSLVDQYLTINLTNSDGTSTESTIGPVYVASGEEPTTLEVKLDTANDQEVYIYDMANIIDLGDLSTKGLQKFKLVQETKLTSLVLGRSDSDYANDELGKNDGSFDLGTNGQYVPYLETLNIENCTGIRNNLSLSALPYLKEIYAKGSNISGVSLANGGNIQHLELPAVTALTFLNQLYYNTFVGEDGIKHLDLEGYTNLNRLCVLNSPKVDTKTLFEQTIVHGADGKDVSSLLYVYLDNLNWNVSLDECVVDPVTQRISNIPLLDILTNINGLVYDNEKGTLDTILKEELDNAYLSGTITIENKDTGIGIDELVLYQKYGKAFPRLKFVYSDENNSIKAYSININNNNGDLLYEYSRKIANTDIADYTIEYLQNWFTPVATEYLEVVDPITGEKSLTPTVFDTKSIKDLQRPSSAQFVYTLRGWATTQQDDYRIIDYDSAEARDAALNSKLAIKVEHTLDENGKWIYNTAVMNGFVLDEEAFEDQTINFYPVYAADLNSHIVYFYDREETGTLLKAERVVYGQAATPPLPPQWLELPEDDITKAYIYPFLGYNLAYDNIVSELKTYATYGQKVLMSSLSGDDISQEYFELDTAPYVAGEAYYNPLATYKIKVKSSFTGEALIVPAKYTVNGETRPVAQIRVYNGGAHDSYCTTLKRLFFEQNNEIAVVSHILDAGSELQPLCNNFEYFDFSALQHLLYVGPSAFYQGKKISITELPDSIKYIAVNSFDSIPGLTITKLPTALEYIDINAFNNCQNLRSLNINTAKNLKVIAQGAFYNCENLTIPDETILYVDTIGENAFYNCHNLVLNFSSDKGASKLRVLEKEAFYNSALGLNELPSNIEILRANCFKMDATYADKNIMNFELLPSSLTTIDSGIFLGRASSQTQWLLNVTDPAAIKINQYAFMGMGRDSKHKLQSIAVPWDITSEEVLEAQPYLTTGWSHNDGIVVVSSLT